MLKKFPGSIKFVFTIILTVTIALLFSGCGKTPATPSSSPSPSSKLLPPLMTASSPSPSIDPNAPPAAYRLLNLRAIPSPEDGANAYLFYVDVENTGGQPGTFSATYRIDNDPVKKESKKLTLAPGQKKQLELIGPQQEILNLGNAYDSEVINERQHVVFCGDLIIPVTLAERPRLLLVASDIKSGDGQIAVSGDVKNISPAAIPRVIVVADFGIASGQIVKTAEAAVVYEPVNPGQTTPFRVTIPDNPAIVVYRVTFKDAAGSTIRAINSETQ
jgi:hypothetical protein